MIAYSVRNLVPALALLSALVIAVPAAAHQETVAYSNMVIRQDGDVQYALKIPVEDLAEALGKADHAALNAPEVRAAEERLFSYFQPLVDVTSGGAPCPVKRNGLDVPEDDRLFAEMRFAFRCPPGAPVTLDYRVFFDVDPRHMGMLEVTGPGGRTRAELIVERPRWEIHPSTEGPPQVRALAGGEAPLEKNSAPAAPPKSVVKEAATSPESAAEPEPLAPEEMPTTTAPKPVSSLIPLLVAAASLALFGLQIVRTRRRNRSLKLPVGRQMRVD